MPKISPKSYPVLILLAGVFLRLLVAFYTHGTNDVDGWVKNAERITQLGLYEDYRQDPTLNHPPVIAYLMGDLLTHDRWTAIPVHLRVKFPSLLGDGIILLTLFVAAIRSPERRSLVLLGCFAASPINIIVSGYHGNTDCLVAAGLFLACWFFERGNYFSSGLALAAGAEVKLIPFLVVPILVFALPRSARWRWMAGFTTGVLPILWSIAIVGGPFLRAVLGYSSIQDYWGVLLLADTVSAVVQGAIQVSHSDWFIGVYKQLGKFIIVGSVCWYGWIWARRDFGTIYLRCGGALCLFAFFAPGFSVQYFAVYPAVLAMFSPRWSLGVSVLASLLAIASYHHYLVSLWPLRSNHIGLSGSTEAIVGLILWSALGLLFLKIARGDFELREPHV